MDPSTSGPTASAVVVSISARAKLMAGLGISVGIVAAGIALVVSMALPKTYEAEACVLVGGLTEESPDLHLADQLNAQTYAGLATSEPLLTKVVTAVGLQIDTTSLKQQVRAEAPTSQRTVIITATGSSPEEAAAIADAVANEIVLLAVPPGALVSNATIVQPAHATRRTIVAEDRP